MTTKTKSALFIWALAALFLSFWAVKLAMTGEVNENSKNVTFWLSYCASLASAVCGAGFMQQWIIAKKK